MVRRGEFQSFNRRSSLRSAANPRLLRRALGPHKAGRADVVAPRDHADDASTAKSGATVNREDSVRLRTSVPIMLTKQTIVTVFCHGCACPGHPRGSVARRPK